jgi:hypothetical protein
MHSGPGVRLSQNPFCFITPNAGKPSPQIPDTRLLSHACSGNPAVTPIIGESLSEDTRHCLVRLCVMLRIILILTLPQCHCAAQARQLQNKIRKLEIALSASAGAICRHASRVQNCSHPEELPCMGNRGPLRMLIALHCSTCRASSCRANASQIQAGLIHHYLDELSVCA